MVQKQGYNFGMGEFTTYFRTYFSGGRTIWVLTHCHIGFPYINSQQKNGEAKTKKNPHPISTPFFGDLAGSPKLDAPLDSSHSERSGA